MEYFHLEYMAQIYFENIESSIMAHSFNLTCEEVIIIMKRLDLKWLKYANLAIFDYSFINIHVRK